jgi:hypothetical protein
VVLPELTAVRAKLLFEFDRFGAGDRFEVLALNDLTDYTLSSPAMSDGHIFMRTTQFLDSIGKG